MQDNIESVDDYVFEDLFTHEDYEIILSAMYNNCQVMHIVHKMFIQALNQAL